MSRQWAINIGLVIVIALIGLWSFKQSNRAESALCVLRGDLVTRAENSRKYLDDLDLHKREPIPGISRADIVQSIANQQRTIDALSGLNCN